MSINNIKRLSMNPHFYALLMQGFLSGYEKPCEIKLPFMAIPILLYAESREKLVNANKRSRIDTLFQSPQIINESRISGKTRLSGYIERYNSLKPYCKEAIIILKEGEIFPSGIGRSRRKTVDKNIDLLLAYFAEEKADIANYNVCVGYGYDYEEAVEFRDRLAGRLKEKGYDIDTIPIFQIGATIGVHTGPYPLGIGVVKRAI